MNEPNIFTKNTKSLHADDIIKCQQTSIINNNGVNDLKSISSSDDLRGMNQDEFFDMLRKQNQIKTAKENDIHNYKMFGSYKAGEHDYTDITEFIFYHEDTEIKINGETKQIQKHHYLPFDLETYGTIIINPFSYNGILYYYNEDTGLFIEDKGAIKSWIQKQFDNATIKGYFPKTQQFSRLKSEMYERYLHYNVNNDEKYPFNQYNGFPVNNGVIVFDESGECINLESYNPKMKYNHKIPINYNPAADTSKIKKILMDWIEEDYKYLIQIPAQAIYQSLPNKTPLKQTYMIVGEANAAKSTYLDLLTKLFGENYISNEQLHDFCCRFNKFNLVNKFLNIGDDLPDITINAFNQMKELSGRRTQKVEPKHQTAFAADITAVHVYTANKPPEINEKIDADDAWWNRWIYLKFQNQFDKVSTWFEENILPNMEGFLLLVINEVQEIIKNGGKLRYIQDPDIVREMWKNNSSTVSLFIESEIERNKDGWIAKDELFDALFLWVDENFEGLEHDQLKKRLPLTTTSLSQKLAREGIDTGERRKEGKKIQAYVGIRWKKNSIYNPIETKNSNII